ncbi:MAG: hypothetical protein AB1444_06755 [Spirochaetota bacterium]
MKLQENQILQLKSAIETALDLVYEKDIYLIENKVHERSIVNRFSIYFQQILDETEFAAYHLDFEYNKNHANPKRTVNFEQGTYPDIILHRRGSNDANVLIIEFKTWWDNNTEIDIKKLKDFTDQNGPYQYVIGYSIVFGRTKSALSKTLVKNGEVCNE